MPPRSEDQGSAGERVWGHWPIRVLFPVYADRSSYQAQDVNGREVALRLDPLLFERSLFLRGREPDPRLAGREGLHLICLPQIRKVRGLTMLRTMFRPCWDVVVTGKIDTIQLLYLAGRGLLGDRRPYLHTVENSNPRPSRLFDTLARFTANRADRAFAISRRIAETPEGWCGCRLDLLYAVGVDPAVFHPARTPAIGQRKRKRVVCCGSFQPRKRPDFFVDMASRFRDHDFVWIGSGELRSGLEERVKAERLGNVSFPGSMPQDGIAKQFRESDVFLFPSVHEGFPKVLVEAMACGLPGLAFDCYGPEAIVDGETGFVVGTDQEMEDRLRELLADEALRLRMGQAAARRALDFTWDKIAKNYERVILETVRGSKGGSFAVPAGAMQEKSAPMPCSKG